MVAWFGILLLFHENDHVYEKLPAAVSYSAMKLACSPGWVSWVSESAYLVALEQKGFKRWKLGIQVLAKLFGGNKILMW